VSSQSSTIRAVESTARRVRVESRPAPPEGEDLRAPARRYTKILEIGSIPPPRGGWGVRIDYVLREMRKARIECAALDVGQNRRQRRPQCDDVQSAWDYARKVLRYLRRGYRIHNHLNGDSPKAYAMVFYAALMSRFFRRPAVLTWHGGQAQRFFPSNGNRLADFVNRMIFGLHGKIICNDMKVKRHIVAYGVRPRKVVPIQAFSRQYLDYEPVRLANDVERFLAQRDPILFCYMCIRPEFYLSVLMNAMRKLVVDYPRLGLVMVGFTEGREGFTGGSQGLRDEIRAARLESNVYFTGDLDHDQFLTLLARADLFVRTPKRDGVCSSLLEALALGVPVVATENPMRPPQVVTYKTEDADDLARAVRQVLALPNSARRPAPPEIPDTVAAEIDVLTDRRRPATTGARLGGSLGGAQAMRGRS